MREEEEVKENKVDAIEKFTEKIRIKNKGKTEKIKREKKKKKVINQKI